jgi:hypothetical protein
MADEACHVFGSTTHVGLTQALARTVTMNAPEESKPSFERRFYGFWLIATPKLFEWFGWIAALGVTQFVYARTESFAVLALLIVGYAALLFYTYAVFRSERIQSECALTIRSTRTRFVPPTTWQIKLAMLSAPLRRSG